MIFVKKSFAEAFFKTQIWADYVEKARKGEQVAGSKYLFRTPDSKGGFWYTYLADFLKRPLKILERNFSITEKQLTAAYEKEKIEKKLRS